MVGRLLYVQLERLRDLREPVDDEVAHLLVGGGDLDEHLWSARLPLALRVHGSEHVRDVEFALLRVPLERANRHGATLRKVGPTLVAVDKMRVSDKPALTPWTRCAQFRRNTMRTLVLRYLGIQFGHAHRYFSRPLYRHNMGVLRGL